MASQFLGSEEYDERAHQLYNDGDYNAALETLKEGLLLYPHSVELHVGLGYTRLARDEVAWARRAFNDALVLDPENEDGMVGMGEVLLRMGNQAGALRLFEQVRRTGCADDLDLLLSMGRSLYRERLFEEARDVFRQSATLHPGSAEAVAALGYTLHRLGDGGAARRELRRALRLDPDHHEARIYLAHLLYDQGNWRGSLQELERVPPAQHWDPLALLRLIELKRALDGIHIESSVLNPWRERLAMLEAETDDIDELLAEIEARAVSPQLDLFQSDQGPARRGGPHRVRMPDGRVFTGTWLEIVQQLRDAIGRAGESLAQFMRRVADEERARSGIGIPTDDPEGFVLGHGRAGRLHIER
jgi:Flp pilus assembly protein TadD